MGSVLAIPTGTWLSLYQRDEDSLSRASGIFVWFLLGQHLLVWQIAIASLAWKITVANSEKRWGKGLLGVSWSSSPIL